MKPKLHQAGKDPGKLEFPMPRIIGVTRRGKGTNNVVLKQADSWSRHFPHCQRRLRWLHCMNDGRIIKDIIYGEWVTGHCPVGRSTVPFKDEQLADDRSGWYHAVHRGVSNGEKRRNQLLEIRREGRKQREQCQMSILHYNFICHTCRRDCHASIGLLSQSKGFSQMNNVWSKKALPLSCAINGYYYTLTLSGTGLQWWSFYAHQLVMVCLQDEFVNHHSTTGTLLVKYMRACMC